MTKICKKCNLEKELDQFYPRRDRMGGNGVTSWCKTCYSNKASKNNTKYYKKNKEKIKIVASIWNKNNKNRLNITKKYRATHKTQIRDKERIKYNNDINFKLMRILRARCSIDTLKKHKKNHSIVLLGCKIDEFRQHLEKYLHKGMSWENHGKVWHIDHRIPISFFDLTDETEQKQAFYFKNCQPMFITDNLKKSDNLICEYASYLES